MSRPATTLTLPERVSTVLACLAVDRRLGGVLFIDLDPRLLPGLAEFLNSMLADESAAPEIVTLGSADTDDDLWWLTRLKTPEGTLQYEMVPGPLIDVPGGPPRTVVVPDLARASMSVARAAITVVGADTAVADRHGRHAAWRPETRWITACARSDLGRLSPHLLDRFPVRVDAAALEQIRCDPRAIRASLDDTGANDLAVPDLPPPAVRGRWASRDRLPAMTDPAIDQVLAAAGRSLQHLRRGFALARTARALAALAGSATTREEHVQGAAELLGLRQPPPGIPSSPFPESGQPSDASPGEPSEVPSDTTPSGPSDGHEPDCEYTAAPEGQPSAPVPLDDTAVPADLLREGMYPEDDPDSVPEYFSLRGPWRAPGRPESARGRVVGAEPTRSLSDMAVLPTVVEAAKLQPTRRRRDSSRDGDLIIRGVDLRRYRYQPRPDTAIVLVLDHTCRHGWEWMPAMAPYLQWAYTRHTVLSVVEFGHSEDTGDELRATMYRTASILDSRLAVSLSRVPGRATPLAHGLDLAVKELRRHLRQAGIASGNSWLIVVSDGRGNVPLESSLRGQVPRLVADEGVTDALRAASAMRPLSGVHKIVLAPPGLTHYAQLPFELADAMGGIVADGTR